MDVRVEGLDAGKTSTKTTTYILKKQTYSITKKFTPIKISANIIEVKPNHKSTLQEKKTMVALNRTHSFVVTPSQYLVFVCHRRHHKLLHVTLLTYISKLFLPFWVKQMCKKFHEDLLQFYQQLWFWLSIIMVLNVNSRRYSIQVHKARKSLSHVHKNLL